MTTTMEGFAAMAKIKHGTDERRSKMMKYEDVDGSFRKFEGAEDQNIFVWMEAFDRMCMDAEWDDFRKLTYLRRSIKNVAYDVALMDGGDSYDSVKEVLLSQFGHDWKPCNAIRRIVARKKKVNETPMEYMTAMRRLGSAAKLDNATIAMFVVDGLDVEPTWKFVLSRITDLVELREAIEHAERCLKESVSVREDDGRMATASDEESMSTRQGTFGHSGEDDAEKKTPIREDLGRTMIVRQEEWRNCLSGNEIGFSQASCPRTHEQENKEAVNHQMFKNATPARISFQEQDTTKEGESIGRAPVTRYEERRKCFNCNIVGHLSVNCTRRRRTYQGHNAATFQKKGYTNETSARVGFNDMNNVKDHGGAVVDHRDMTKMRDYCNELMVERELCADGNNRVTIVPEVVQKRANNGDTGQMSMCSNRVILDAMANVDAKEMKTKANDGEILIPVGNCVDQETAISSGKGATVDEDGGELRIDEMEAGKSDDVQCIVEKEDLIARDRCLVTGRNGRHGIGVTCDNDKTADTEGGSNSLAWTQVQGYLKAFRRGFV